MVNILFWLIKWTVVVSLGFAFLCIFILGSWIVLSWLVTKRYAKCILGCSVEFPELFPSVKPVELTEAYRRKLEAAQRFFKQEAVIPEAVHYFFLPRMKTGRCYCDRKPSLTIVFSEGFLQYASDEKLAGIQAHELAHLEEISKMGSEKRPHWVVDQRAAELTSAHTVAMGIMQMVLVTERVRREHRVLCFLRRVLTLGGDHDCPRPPLYYDALPRIAPLLNPAIREVLERHTESAKNIISKL